MAPCAPSSIPMLYHENQHHQHHQQRDHLQQLAQLKHEHVDNHEHSTASKEQLRAANVALSKTVLTPNALSPYLPAFIATLSYSIWHGRPFAEMAARPPHGLKQFARFTMDLLRATGLSFSVVLLALKFVHRLKSRRPDLRGAEGSECRLLVCTLMLAMKCLMDNTYSNKTWHKVSRIPLQEINVTEMEFLAQVNFDLHVQEEDYFDWLAFIEHAVVEFRRITSEVQQQQALAKSIPHPLPSIQILQSQPLAHRPSSSSPLPSTPSHPHGIPAHHHHRHQQQQQQIYQPQHKLHLHCTPFSQQPSPPVTPSSANPATVAIGIPPLHPALPMPTCPQSSHATSACTSHLHPQPQLQQQYQRQRQQPHHHHLDPLAYDFAQSTANAFPSNAAPHLHHHQPSHLAPLQHPHLHPYNYQSPQHYPSPYTSPTDNAILSSRSASSAGVAPGSVAAGHARAVRGA